jgi:hypothetical protein
VTALVLQLTDGLDQDRLPCADQRLVLPQADLLLRLHQPPASLLGEF